MSTKSIFKQSSSRAYFLPFLDLNGIFFSEHKVAGQNWQSEAQS